MKNISLKKLMLALLLTAAVPTLTAQVHVGDILCEGNAIISSANYPSSGATAIGVVFYVDNTGQHGWAVALEDVGSCPWGPKIDYPLPNYTNKRQAIYDLDGYYNTPIMRQGSASHTASHVVDFENGWYIPAIGQLNYLYGNLVEVNESLTVAGGVVFPASGGYYWSSTEYSADVAWVFLYTGNLSNNLSKSNSYRVRAVRNF